ncbi:MAG: pentapeptide repeat-containing protein [Alphaproteobacteria bacterium]|nr:pentapeptide repeat-containing protein [Alphaproteobacteria bacterium]
MADQSDSVMYCGDLDGAMFKEARFAGAVPRNIDLSLANLMEIDLSGCQAFTGINDIQVSLRKSMRAPMKWVSSDGRYGEHGSFSKLDVTSVNFRCAD